MYVKKKTTAVNFRLFTLYYFDQTRDFYNSRTTNKEDSGELFCFCQLRMFVNVFSEDKITNSVNSLVVVVSDSGCFWSNKMDLIV